MKRLILFLFSFSCGAAQVQFVTESLPPYQVVDENRQLVGGTSFTVIKELIQRSEIDATIDVMPWARALKTTLDTPNTFIFSIARSSVREHKFDWVIPLRHLTYHFYGLHHLSKDKFSHIDDVKALKVAAVRGSIEAEFLARLGFKEGDNLILTNSYAASWQLVAIGRADAVYGEENVVHCLSRNIGFDASPFHTIFSTDHDLDLYVAANKSTDPKVIENLKMHYQAMVAEGRVAAIVKSQEAWIFNRPARVAP